jgi:hypothetical protein
MSSLIWGHLRPPLNSYIILMCSYSMELQHSLMWLCIIATFGRVIPHQNAHLCTSHFSTTVLPTSWLLHTSILPYNTFHLTPWHPRNLGFSSMRIVSCRPGIICSQDLEWSHNVWKWSLQNVHSHDPMVRKPSQYKEFYNAQEMCLWDPATPHIKDDSVVN